MANLKTERGRQMRCDQLYARLGLDAKAVRGLRLPAHGLDAQDVDGTPVYVLPPSGGKHRVIAICSCGKHVPAGRLEQHQKGATHAHPEVLS